MNGIEISATRQDDVGVALTIANSQLGDGYIKACDLQRDRSISLVAKISDVVVGFCFGTIITESELYAKLPQLKLQNVNAFDSDAFVGLVNSIAVDAWSKKLGVGHELMAKCLADMTELHIDVVFMIGWRSNEGVNIRSLANRNGFSELLEMPHYWRDDSLNHQYQCPTCGAPPCNCSAVLFVKDSRSQQPLPESNQQS